MNLFMWEWTIVSINSTRLMNHSYTINSDKIYEVLVMIALINYRFRFGRTKIWYSSATKDESGNTYQTWSNWRWSTPASSQHFELWYDICTVCFTIAKRSTYSSVVHIRNLGQEVIVTCNLRYYVWITELNRGLFVRMCHFFSPHHCLFRTEPQCWTKMDSVFPLFMILLYYRQSAFTHHKNRPSVMQHPGLFFLRLLPFLVLSPSFLLR